MWLPLVCEACDDGDLDWLVLELNGTCLWVRPCKARYPGLCT